MLRPKELSNDVTPHSEASNMLKVNSSVLKLSSFFNSEVVHINIALI